MLKRKKSLEQSAIPQDGMPKQKSIYAQLMLQTDDKVRLQTLSQFLKTYNHYVNKLLLAKVDPFIEKQNKNYLRVLDLAKISNVF